MQDWHLSAGCTVFLQDTWGKNREYRWGAIALGVCAVVCRFVEDDVIKEQKSNWIDSEIVKKKKTKWN